MTSKNSDDYVLITEENSKLIPEGTTVYITDDSSMSRDYILNVFNKSHTFSHYDKTKTTYPVRCLSDNDFFSVGYVHKSHLTSHTNTIVEDEDLYLLVL